MNELPTSVLGRTGLTVTKLAYGAMDLRGIRNGGGRDLGDAEAGMILNAVLDTGINLIDTSPDYGPSEELIGRHISSRRSEFILTSKCGCAVSPTGDHLLPDVPHVFTRENIRAGVEQSLRRMKTDHIDVVQFHLSPTRAELDQHDSLAALHELQREGKVRFIGISSVPPNLANHIAMDVFDVFQIPYSGLEADNEAAMSEAAATGAGIIVRGGLARGMAGSNAEVLQRLHERARPSYAKRRDLWFAAALDDVLGGMGTQEFMLRMTISHPAMDTTIVGTTNLRHLSENAAAVRKGPLPEDQLSEARRRLDAVRGGS